MNILHRFYYKIIKKYDIKGKQYHLIIVCLLDIGMFNLDGHGPVFALQVHLGQWPSFTGRKHGNLHTRAVHIDMDLVREVGGFENC